VTNFRIAVLLLAAALGGCNLTYDREGTKFEDGASLTCSFPTPQKCGSGSSAYCTRFDSSADCGSCGHACTTGQVCAGGTCTTGGGGGCPPGPSPDQCPSGPGFICTNRNSDPFNCGTCGTVCASGVCTAGFCQLSCSGATPDLCGTPPSQYCANKQTDPNNCGACSTVCSAIQGCSAGTCTTTATPLALDTTVTGSIGAATDKIIYSITVPAGGRDVRVQTFDTTGTTCLSIDPKVAVYDATGFIQGTNDDGGVDYCFDLTLTLTAGTYYVVVDKSSAGPSSFGYTLQTTSHATGSSPLTIRCTFTSSNYCEEVTGSFTLADQASYEEGYCRWYSGTPAVGACDRTGTLTGYCDGGVAGYGTGSTYKWFYQGAYYTAAAAQADCEYWGHVWVAGGAGTPLAVAPLFPLNGINWNSWVDASSGSPSDAICPGIASPCVHAGDRRATSIPGRTVCTGLTANDALGAFDWTCDATTNPVRMVTTGLKAGKRLADLIDATSANPTWKVNTVTVYDGSTVIGTSTPTAWWSDPLAWVPASGNMVSTGTVYVAKAGGQMPPYQMIASRLALAVPAGLTLTGTTGLELLSSLNQTQLWVEGDFGTSAPIDGLMFEGITHSRLRDVKVTRPFSTGSYTGMELRDSSRNLVDRYASSGSSTGLSLRGSMTTDNLLTTLTLDSCDGFCLSVTNNAAKNVVHDVVAHGRGGSYGLYVNGSFQNTFSLVDLAGFWYGVDVTVSPSNRFTDLTVAASRAIGVRLTSSDDDAFTGLRVSDTNGDGGLSYPGHGIVLEDSRRTFLADVLSVSNYGDGLRVGGSSYDAKVFGATFARNAGAGLHALGWYGLYQSVVALENYAGIVMDGAQGTLLANVAFTDNTTNGLEGRNSASTELAGDVAYGANQVHQCFNDGSSQGFGDGGTNCVWSYPTGSNPNPPVTSIAAGGLGSFVAEVSGYQVLIDLFDSAWNWFPAWSPYSAWTRSFGTLPIDGPLGCPGSIGAVTYVSCGAGWQGSGNAVTFDWSLRVTSPFLAPPPFGTLPDASMKLTHAWSIAATSTFFFDRAYEVIGDAIGNDDGICDPGESCVELLDLGAYQGHGSTGSTTISGGTTFWHYLTNGF
jgi:hypothetical protein